LVSEYRAHPYVPEERPLSFRLPTQTSELTRDDLRRLTNQLVAAVQKLLRRAVDADVTFRPEDPTASLAMWPNQPHLENTAVLFPQLPALGPVECFLLGLKHEAGHLDQIKDVMSQARAHRQQKTRLGRWRNRREAQRSKKRAESRAMLLASGSIAYPAVL
jgi:hypothetical protein